MKLLGWISGERDTNGRDGAKFCQDQLITNAISAGCVTRWQVKSKMQGKRSEVACT